MEFFNNIWNWFVDNKDAIVGTLTSANFIAFVGSIVLLIKNLKSTKDNTKSSEELTQTLSKVDAVSELTNVTNTTSNETQKKVDETLNEVNEIKNELEEVKTENSEQIQLVLDKINAILEAQSVVWSTIKDDTVRNTVTNIITSAKYKESSVIADAKSELEELQQKFIEKTEEIKSDIIATVDNVKKATTITNESTNDTNNDNDSDNTVLRA